MAQGVCRLDVELQSNGEWETLKTFANYEEAAQVVNILVAAGIDAMVSCACGSYEYGACELCKADEDRRKREAQVPAI